MNIRSKNSFILSKRLRRLLAKPWLLPDKILIYLLTKISHNIILDTDSFSWLQAIFYSWRINQWKRYACVARTIKALDEQPLTVLDVGGEKGVIKEFLSLRKYRLCVLDIDAEALKQIRSSRLMVITGDGSHLPFKDGSFDVVISIDSLEHVPDSKKPDYCCELKRVAKKYVIIHCPADSSNGKFRGTTCDTKFLQWYQQRFEKDELNIVQHLNSGLPKVEELAKLFPDAIIVGKQNVEVWLKYMRRAYTSYLRFLNGLFYKLSLQKKDDLSPYYACLLVWRKE